MKKFRAALVCFAALGLLVSCDKKSGEAIVLSKEHIDAAIPKKETPPPENTPARSDEPEPAAETETTPRPLAPDEIVVDQYIMKKEDRGTGRDPRAGSEPLWLVRVRMVRDGRLFDVPAKEAQFSRLKVGDRVPITYHVGKYTGTVWSAEIDQ